MAALLWAVDQLDRLARWLDTRLPLPPELQRWQDDLDRLDRQRGGRHD